MWKVCAWRDKGGHASVEVGTMGDIGDEQNGVMTFSLMNSQEIEHFIAEVRLAWLRANAASGPLFEEMPGPYDDGWL